jgi:hypothetical protein
MNPEKSPTYNLNRRKSLASKQSHHGNRWDRAATTTTSETQGSRIIFAIANKSHHSMAKKRCQHRCCGGILNWRRKSRLCEVWLLKQDQQMTSRRDSGPCPMGSAPIHRSSAGSSARWYRESVDSRTRSLWLSRLPWIVPMLKITTSPGR